jgi:PAS domain S-box-containing protein
MPEKTRVLVLEDSPDDAELIRRLLSKENPDFEFNLAPDKDTFLHALDHFDPNVILADNSLPRFCAKEALEIAHQRIPGIPFILVTGSVSEEFAAEIIKLGADDYILKDRMIRLPAAIDTAIKNQRTGKERLEAQEGHRKSDERFQTLSKATRDAVWDWNLLTGEVWWNESFYALLGYDPKLPAPGPDIWSKRIHPSDRVKVMARLKGIIKNGVPSWEDEFRLRLSDGSYGTVLDRAYVVEDECGEPVRVIGALVNITEQKRVIKEMEILSLIARETSNSVLIFNRHSGHTSWVNQAFTRYTGYRQQDLSGRDPWSIFQGPETDRDTLSFVMQQIRNNLPFSCDVLIYSKQGEKRWQSVTGEPIREFDVHAANYFVIATDISERRRMEEERNQILAAVNLKLAFFLEEPDGNLEIIEICRKDLKKAIPEVRKLSNHMVMPPAC